MTTTTETPVVAGRHTLPSGAWVECRDPLDVTRGDWLRALNAIPDLATNGDLAGAVLITAWSYEMPIPSVDGNSVADVLQVDAKELDRLFVPALRLLHPDFAAPAPVEEPAPAPVAPAVEEA